MKSRELYKKIGEIDDKLILEADNVDMEKKLDESIESPKVIKPANCFAKKRIFIGIASLAACLVLVFSISLIYMSNSNTIELSDKSKGVSVRYINKVSGFAVSADLAWLTEEELFSEFNTSIFEGVVTEINNIKIDFNGSEEYRAIANIKVEKVYRGDCMAGDIVTVLVPCPIDTKDEYWVEETGVISSIRIGMRGIFMPTKYDDKSYYEYNGARLMLMDIAQYGFPDGERYAFLETDNGVIFEKEAYKSIENAKSLDEIEKYIIKMINVE